MNRVLVLGGGVGGVVAAGELAKSLGRTAEVTLVDREDRHHFPPSYPWLAMGWRTPEETWRPLSRLRARDVSVRRAEVTRIDPAERTVTAGSQTLPYDYLLVALGAELAPSEIPGFEGEAHHTYDLAHSVRLRDALRSFHAGRVLVGVSRLPFKCPAAPYEVALLMDHAFRERGIRERVDMTFVTPEPYPLPAAGAAIGERAEALLRSRDIALSTKHEIAHVDPEGKVVHFAGGRREGYDLLVAVPPHTTPAAVRASGLARDGPWVPVDPHTLRTSYDDVYAFGDVAKVPTPRGNVPSLPKAGVFAHGQAKVAAKNVAADLLGGEGARWDGRGSCFMEIGYGKGAFVKGNFLGEGRPPSMRGPGRVWHWAKVLFERGWLRRHFR